MSERDLVIIRRYLSAPEAHALRGLLTEHGVRAAVLNEHASQNIEAGGISTHGVMLAVWTEDVPRAEALLQELAATPNPLMEIHDEEDAAWLRHQRLECPRCGSDRVGMGLPVHLVVASGLGVAPLLALGQLPLALVLLSIAIIAAYGRSHRCLGCGAHGTRAWFEGRG